LANINFNLQENGYNIAEVNSYIEMLQLEYANAVAWGEEKERELEALRDAMKQQGVYFTIDEDNQNEVVKEVFDRLTDSLEKVKSDAHQRASDIVSQAKEEASLIMRRAKENSVEIRTQNVTIMKNLKSIGEMIDVIIEKGIQ